MIPKILFRIPVWSSCCCELCTVVLAGAEEDACVPSEKNTAAKAVWRQIQDRMKPPLCKGHGEPCVIRQVKKGGVNQGKPLTRIPLL